MLLTINTGSSSLKATAYEWSDALGLVLAARAERIGGADSRLVVERPGRHPPEVAAAALPDHAAALAALVAWLDGHGYRGKIHAVGHRIVHGGPQLREPRLVTPEVVEELRRVIPFAPEHLPQALAAIDQVGKALPGLRQVVCFDTAFHRTLPRRARLLPIPYEYFEAGVARYGFHGLSYEYLVERLREADPQRVGGRAVLAHLGNGASMAAVNHGRCVDTSMSFTPAAGLVMGTRSGDLDPGVLVYLIEQGQLDPHELNRFVNKRCGMTGIAGVSDMRELLARRDADDRAAAAVEAFTYQARKFVAAYAAALGGIDTLAFSGGIGERSSPIRAEICSGLEFLGIRLDEARNAAGADVISSEASPVVVRVIGANEDLMIARHTRRLLAGQA